MKNLCVLLLLVCLGAVQASMYIGCYKDASSRALPYRYSLGVKSIEECVTGCQKKGYKYAGAEYYSECYCGNSYGRYGKATNCNLKCKSGQICGGGWALSVYGTAPVNAVNVGCFKDNPKKRALDVWKGRVDSPQQCVEKCAQIGKPYSAVQDGWGCRCGDVFYTYGFSDKCNKKCKNGAPCGGWSINSVYKVATSATEGVGCFKDDPKSRALNMWKGRVSSPGQCVEICRKAYKPYAGVQDGWGCRCGDAFYKYGFSDKCNKKCKNGAACGGWSINSIYRVAPLQVSNYVGCYKDAASRALGYKYSLGVKSIGECVTGCQNKGYRYAGLEYYSECYCANSYDRYGKATNCNLKCKSGQICGGSWALSVYGTGIVDERDTLAIKSWEYTGKSARTVTGKTCQSWNTNSPHKSYHHTLPNNYCRDPSKDGFLWCYTTDSKKVWEKCDSNVLYGAYIGCYKDAAKRALSYRYSLGVKSIEECAVGCEKKGYKYAGLEYYSECYCGNSYDRYGKATNCNLKCKSGQICGGGWALSVFGTGQAQRKDGEGEGPQLFRRIASGVGIKGSDLVKGAEHYAEHAAINYAKKEAIKGAEDLLKKETGVKLGVKIGKHSGDVNVGYKDFGVGFKYGKNGESGHIGIGGDSVGFSYKGGKHPVYGESASVKVGDSKYFEKGKIGDGKVSLQVGDTTGIGGVASNTVEAGFHAGKGGFGLKVGDQLSVGKDFGVGGSVGISDKHGNLVLGGKVDLDLFGHKFAIGGKIDVTKDAKIAEHAVVHAAKVVGKDIKKGWNDVKHGVEHAADAVGHWFRSWL